MASNYQRILRDNLREYGEGTRHLEFFGRLYSDKTHFIYELLQNAEDAGATRVSFFLSSGDLKMKHDGRLFNEQDVRGVCGVGEGTKAEDLTQIGKFGIGFKSVYAYTLTPEIHSGDEHFRIEHYVRPFAADPLEPGSNWTTLFILPFDRNDSGAEEAFKDIAARLINLGVRTLLFLRNIKQIEWAISGGPTGCYLRETQPIAEKSRRVTVIGQKNHEEEEEEWLIFDQPLRLPDGDGEVRVEIAFRLFPTEEGNGKTIKKIKDSPLVVFFPTEKETRLGFLLQGPFRTTLARDNIPKEDDWNQKLLQTAADLLSHTLPCLRDLGYLTVSLLEALPIKPDDFPDGGMFFPLAAAVRQTLREQPLLPAADGTFVSASQAKLAGSADLRELVGHKQLQRLLDADQPIRWLSGEITERGTPELWKYLRNALDIEEIDAEYFARRLNEGFLQKQGDKWLIRFYAFLANQRALWRPPRANQAPGILRNKPIIRLSDNRQVIPFQLVGDKEQPNAYLPTAADSEIESEFPLVKESIVRDEAAREFLQELGLPQADLVSEVIDKILPQYKEAKGRVISPKEHNRHIDKILRAWAVTSEDNRKPDRERLVAALKETPFLNAVNNVTGSEAYKKPEEIYFRSPELELYFQGYQDAWFINENKGETVWEKLRVANIPRFLEFDPQLSWQQKSALRRDYGCTRDWPANDYRVDGLENFLDNLSNFNEEQQKSRSKQLWSFLVDFFKDMSDWDKNSFFHGTYKWFYYSKHYAYFNAHWLKLLQGNPWLPSPAGGLCKPAEITFDQLPPEFPRDDYLIKKLGFKPDEGEEIRELAQKTGVPEDILVILKSRPELMPELRRLASQPIFPSRSSAEGSEERYWEGIEHAPPVEFNQRVRNIRISRGKIDPQTWLRSQYTNQDDEMVCQLCKQVMPFKKLDGNYYFEAVEIIKGIKEELEEKYLALCPVCAAKYKYYVKGAQGGRNNMNEIKFYILENDALEIPVKLENEEETIKFTQLHYKRLKLICQKQ
uniref:Sacsin/Nov domain-containing protein n=1 Tax=Desulfobacca acetoxidans TaxID=60893 RepID=A0A7V4G6H8_9BACT